MIEANYKILLTDIMSNSGNTLDLTNTTLKLYPLGGVGDKLVFDQPITFNWVPNFSGSIKIELIGAGGGGGLAVEARKTNIWCGNGGGGGGGYTRLNSFTVQKNSTYKITVGRGGSGQLSANNGGDTYFKLNDNTTIVYSGGGTGGGSSPSDTEAGLGGIGGLAVGQYSGDYAIRGGYGEDGRFNPDIPRHYGAGGFGGSSAYDQFVGYNTGSTVWFSSIFPSNVIDSNQGIGGNGCLIADDGRTILEEATSPPAYAYGGGGGGTTSNSGQGRYGAYGQDGVAIITILSID